MYEHLCSNPESTTELLKCHRIQDLQSYWLHEEAVRLVRQDLTLIARLEHTLARWSYRNDPRNESYRRRWLDIISRRDWDSALARDDAGQALRQASPLATILPETVRLSVLERVRELKARCRN